MIALQQQDQLNTMSSLTAYLREAQAQQQAQAQAQAQAQSNPHNPSETHPGDPSWATVMNERQQGDPSWATAMSERQQLAFRSLSEAAVDNRYGGRHSSEMLRAALQAPASNSSSFPGDIIQPQSQIQSQNNSHLSNVSTAGKSDSFHCSFCCMIPDAVMRRIAISMYGCSTRSNHYKEAFTEPFV